MIVVLDTNVLLRYADPNDPAHPIVITALGVLRATGYALHLVPQNLYEFWVVATRPLDRNGLGLTVPECEQTLTPIEAAFPVLLDKPSLLAEWRSLVMAHACKGKIAHDARIVAAMRTHGLTHLLTFNVGDFARFPGLTVLDPKSIGASPITTS